MTSQEAEIHSAWIHSPHSEGFVCDRVDEVSVVVCFLVYSVLTGLPRNVGSLLIYVLNTWERVDVWA